LIQQADVKKHVVCQRHQLRYNRDCVAVALGLTTSRNCCRTAAQESGKLCTSDISKQITFTCSSVKNVKKKLYGRTAVPYLTEWKKTFSQQRKLLKIDCKDAQTRLLRTKTRNYIHIASVLVEDLANLLS